MATIDYYVSTVQELNNAILWSGKGGGADNGVADNHVIHITAGATINLTQELYAINLAAGDTLTINGNGADDRRGQLDARLLRLQRHRRHQ